MVTYSLVDAPPVECRHSSFSCAWVVVLDKSVIEAFALLIKLLVSARKARIKRAHSAEVRVVEVRGEGLE